jgi:hypothetical protein
MWYMLENTSFFVINVVATAAILTALCFGIPPFINWLEGVIAKNKMNSQ